MTNSNDKTREKIQSLFQQAKDIPLEPSPFMKTRILARGKERQAKKRILWWKSWALGSAVAAAALLFIVFWSLPRPFEAKTNQNILVRIEVQEIQHDEIAFADVKLPEDVFFYSEQFPELRERREIRVAWKDRFSKDALPVILRSDSPGLKRVKLRFLDEEQEVLQERELLIRFET